MDLDEEEILPPSLLSKPKRQKQKHAPSKEFDISHELGLGIEDDDIPDSVVTWSKRIGEGYQEQVKKWNKERCPMCFRQNETSHKCDKRKLSMAQAVDTVLQTNTSEMTRGESLWALSMVSNHLLSKFLTKTTQHRQNSNKTKQLKSHERLHSAAAAAVVKTPKKRKAKPKG